MGAGRAGRGELLALTQRCRFARRIVHTWLFPSKRSACCCSGSLTVLLYTLGTGLNAAHCTLQEDAGFLALPSHSSCITNCEDLGSQLLSQPLGAELGLWLSRQRRGQRWLGGGPDAAVEPGSAPLAWEKHKVIQFCLNVLCQHFFF